MDYNHYDHTRNKLQNYYSLDDGGDAQPIEDEREGKADEMPASGELALFSYNGANGAKYAEIYYDSPNPNFYYAYDADCTNFVSQCVWAAYGGWKPGDDDETMRLAIWEGKRMTEQGGYIGYWYANDGGGGEWWESVNDFWDYTTSPHEEGPVADGYNNEGKYSNIAARSIQVGDVLQFRNGNVGPYHHSVYVVAAGRNYNSVVVCQHSVEAKRPLTVLINGFGGFTCYMRLMRFKPAYLRE